MPLYEGLGSGGEKTAVVMDLGKAFTNRSRKCVLRQPDRGVVFRRCITTVFKMYLEKPVRTRMRVQSCRHLKWKLPSGTCLVVSSKNFASATAQLNVQVVLGVKRASLAWLLMKMSESPCCTPNIISVRIFSSPFAILN
ncbi:hypothetical protein AAES_07535 [Amazona aestiva]|uniref:Uncharacterized protein n=1 Tax=Amazona aestiva TaxID=12930 RepID=A0A0Q3U3P3_AMAAE|nr:hypothetical protein AAES_07535 [Amazona aestiva]